MTASMFHDATPATHHLQLFEIVENAYNNREEAFVFVGSEERAVAIDRIL